MLGVLRARGWTELAHDVKCARVQLDLVGRAPSGTLSIVEVKMQSDLGIAGVSPGQRGRLMRAARVLGEIEPTQLVLALVESGGVRLLPMD